MSRKKFTFKGFTVEEMQAKSMEEVGKLMPSRVRRSLKRGLGEMEKRLMIRVRKVRKEVDSGKKQMKPIRTHCRNMPVLPEMIGLEFEVYNGKEYVRFFMVGEMLGQYIGDFAITVKPVKHNAPGIGATRSSLFVPVK
jgi:small subunit ribosomal protein S19